MCITRALCRRCSTRYGPTDQVISSFIQLYLSQIQHTLDHQHTDRTHRHPCTQLYPPAGGTSPKFNTHLITNTQTEHTDIRAHNSTHQLVVPLPNSTHTITYHEHSHPYTHSVHTLRAHTPCAHSVRTLRAHTPCAHSVRTLSAHTQCAHSVHTLSAHTQCTHSVYTLCAHKLPKFNTHLITNTQTHPPHTIPPTNWSYSFSRALIFSSVAVEVV